MESMKINKEFNFYKSLEINNINAEILGLHPSVHAFWTKQTVKSSFMKVLNCWGPVKQVSSPQTCQLMKVDDLNLQN